MTHGNNPDCIIIVRPASIQNEEEMEHIKRLRFSGYKGCFKRPEHTLDEFDALPSAINLIAYSSTDEPLGVMRLLDRRGGPIELDRFYDVPAILGEDIAGSCVEADRFTVEEVTATL